MKEASVYASIRQAKAKTGMAEELARRIKEGAIPIVSDVEGFRAYYVVYAPDDTVTAISIFNDYAGAAESNRRILAWIEQSLTPLLAAPATAMAGPDASPTFSKHRWREFRETASNRVVRARRSHHVGERSRVKSCVP